MGQILKKLSVLHIVSMLEDAELSASIRVT
jgi:hypothetical protein